jgi:hypothetical protein
MSRRFSLNGVSVPDLDRKIRVLLAFPNAGILIGVEAVQCVSKRWIF